MKTPHKLITFITKAVLFLLAWFLSMIAIAFIGAYLYPEGDIPPLFAIAALLIPIALATWTVAPMMKKTERHEISIGVPCNQPIDCNRPPKDILKSIYCTNCGTKLMGNANFCSKCGAKIFSAVYTEPVSSVTDIESSNRAQAGLPTKTYRVTGVEHYRDNIINLASENDDYNKTKRELVDDLMTEERIWKYNFYPVKVSLVPEPENPYDSNAIKVIVDYEHVGYIKKGSCKHLLKVIAEGRLGDIDCTIGGGPYKYIYEDYDDNGNEKYEMERDEVDYSVVLHISEHEA